MKTYLKISSIFLFTVLVFSQVACKKEVIEPVVNIENTSVVVSLTDTELEDLKILREEEKLARDVYSYAYAKYGTMIFNNISTSEQSHMDQVLLILQSYGISDPADENAGVFNNTELQELYDTLTAMVDISQPSALMVGATIEDLDIYDIKAFFTHTNKQDILDMYTTLECGSRNHMRSYYKKITDGGETYTPQYITQDEYDIIVNSEKEICN